jgi:hypothetical protein
MRAAELLDKVKALPPRERPQFLMAFEISTERGQPDYGREPNR